MSSRVLNQGQKMLVGQEMFGNNYFGIERTSESDYRVDKKCDGKER